MRKQFFVVMALVALLGGCAMGPPPGAYYVAPSATSTQGQGRIPLAAPTPATPQDVICYQQNVFGSGYFRHEVLLYRPATPPVCTEPLEPYGYAPQPYGYGGGYSYQPYGYGYVRPFVLFPHLFGDWGDDDR